MKKTIALILATMMVLSLFVGCGNSTPAETEAPKANASEQKNDTPAKGDTPEETEAVSKEPVTLTVWIRENLRLEDYETNAMTLWLQEHANVELEFSTIPAEDMPTKVNVALTAGAIEDLPDIIIGNNATASQMQEWADAGTILPLTEYYNNPELAVNINEAVERTGVNFVEHMRSPDGEIYGIPQYNQSYGNEYPAKLWLYRPWLDALKAEIPTTTEEFYELLKQVANTDLNGNGKKDEIPVMGGTGAYDLWFEYLMNAFVYAGDSQMRVVEDGKVSVAYNTEEYKEGLAYIQKLMSEGLIASESLTVDVTQFNTLVNSEDPTVFSFAYYGSTMFNDPARRAEWVCIAPLVGPHGVQYATYAPTVAANAQFYVTANCDNPEAAFVVGDLMCSEYIGISQRFGLEGTNWDYPENAENANNYKASIDGFDLYMIAYDDSSFWGGSEITNYSWRQVGPFVRQYAIANGLGVPLDNTNQETINFNAGATLYQTGGWAPKECIPTLIFTSDEQFAISEIQSNLNTYVKEYWAGVLIGNKNLEGDWDAYLQQLEKYGLSDYLDVVQTVYDRMYK